MTAFVIKPVDVAAAAGDLRRSLRLEWRHDERGAANEMLASSVTCRRGRAASHLEDLWQLGLDRPRARHPVAKLREFEAEEPAATGRWRRQLRCHGARASR